MVKANRNHTRWIYPLLVIAGLVIVVILVINPLFKNMLTKRIENKLVGNFYYNYDHLSVDLFSRSVTFENVSWRFPKDTTIFYHTGNIRQFSIRGVSLMSLIMGRHFRIKEIFFDSLSTVTAIETLVSEDSVEEVKSATEPLNFYELIKGQLTSLEIGKIRINNGSAIWLNQETKKIYRKIDHVQLDITQVELDSTIAISHNGWFTVDDAMLQGKNGELFLADNIHKIKLKNFQLDYKKKSIVIDSLALIPLFTKAQMPSAHYFETDRLEITAPSITVKGMDVARLIYRNEFRIENLRIDDLRLSAFRDKNSPQPNHLQISLPQMLLAQSHLNLKIDTIRLTNAYIRYEELSELTAKRGSIFFSNLKADFYNITNDSLSYIENSSTGLNVSARLMDKSELKATFNFNLSSTNGNHTIVGKVDPFELTDLNPIFVPLSAISIRSGHVDKMVFNFKLNNDVSEGKMTFLYSNLKIDILNKDDLKQKQFGTTIKSLLANAFVVTNSNPTGNNIPRVGVIHFNRANDKSTFNYWWNSILEGMKSTVINGKEDK